MFVVFFTLRVDQRGFGVVRSDAELSELAYELFEQEEASVRFRKTHATIPPMLIDRREREMRFYNNNSLIPDPMALHRESKFTNIWTDEEKAIFRDKLVESAVKLSIDFRCYASASCTCV